MDDKLTISLWIEPADYKPDRSYVAGNQVTDRAGAYWEAIGAVEPGTYPGSVQINGDVVSLVWVPAPAAGRHISYGAI